MIEPLPAPRDDLQTAAVSAGLVRHFRQVADTRMRGLPIVNPALEVEAVGFARTSAGILGVLITPWFISLVLLPEQADDGHRLPLGSVCRHRFASGLYAFQVAGDESIGRYQTCSLLSPVTGVADQQTAVQIARAALAALHDPAQTDTGSGTRAAELARRWQADEAPPAMLEGAVPPPRVEDRTLSRRAFLGGRPNADPEETR